MSESLATKCLWCDVKLEKPYIDPDSDGVIDYNWKLYCSSQCENHNEYE